MSDAQRISRNRQVMSERGLDAIVCSRPTTVLLLAGYWPISGYTVVIATAQVTHLLIPSHEAALAKDAAVDGVHPYEIGSLKSLPTPLEAIEPTLREVLGKLNLDDSCIGYEASEWVQPAPYVALTSFGDRFSALLQTCAPQAKLAGADDALQELRSNKTDAEIEKIRSSCVVTGRAFARARSIIRAGETEMHIAAQTGAELLTGASPHDRCGGFAFCMSGPNAAEAYQFFQFSRERTLTADDLALVHCNSNVNGYWTDVTRTFHLGKPSSSVQKMYDAVFDARRAALHAIKPGTRCSDVDRAARSVMNERGFGKEFKNPLGHGVGFAAMDHNARPRLHPVSPDVLQTGMVFNLEPAIYIDGKCGMRHCDVIACGESGPHVLTDFLQLQGELIVS